MNPLDALANHLGDLSLATPGIDLFLRILDQPDELVALVQYGGEIGGWRNDDGLAKNDEPRFQLFVRSRAFDTARSRANTLFNALHMQHRTVRGVKFYKVRGLQRPFYLRRDESDRIVFTANMAIHNLLN